jgi:hypothetical protein
MEKGLRNTPFFALVCVEARIYALPSLLGEKAGDATAVLLSTAYVSP